MKRTIGVFAHVDAGKTTFCEHLLYSTEKIKSPGSVDSHNTVMDYEETEKKRGITIFAGTAGFSCGVNEFYLIDTPGHVDFSAEMERALSVLDGAVLVISGTDYVQSHTIQIFRLLKERRIPIYIFINKMDFPTANAEKCIEDIGRRLTDNLLFIEKKIDFKEEKFIEELCSFDDELLEKYLEGSLEENVLAEKLNCLINNGKIIAVHCGSAAKGYGIDEIMDTINRTLLPRKENYNGFAARVFKIRYDEQGNRITFLKILEGSLQVKDEILYSAMDMKEKIHEIRKYDGENYISVQKGESGDIIGVTGLISAEAGMGLGACSDNVSPSLTPALKAAVIYDKSHYEEVYKCLKRLEAQDPMLKIDYVKATGEMEVSVMGKIQLEVLEEIIRDKYGLEIGFGAYKVVYRETVKEAVMGYGHYEPLRHYGEVHLRIEPNPGRGIEFASECHVDDLPKQHQNLIQHFLLSKEHKGILTGSLLTDVKLVLTKGAYHLKHTEGGDLRESSWRAVRQGLEKAENVLLEPFYKIRADGDKAYMGRIISDLTRLKCELNPPEFTGDNVVITGRGPVKTLIEYPENFLSATKGTGSINLSFEGYFPCHNSSEVIEERGYDKERDIENPSSSVFCAKGAGFEVKWYEAESYMHLLK